MLHNRYRLPGGEDAVVQAEAEMLRSRGMQVKLSTWDNDINSEHQLTDLLRAGWSSAWSAKSEANVTDFVSLSGRMLSTCITSGFGLHPRRTALHTLLESPPFRRCTIFASFVSMPSFSVMAAFVDCLGRTPWRGIVHRCYRGAFVDSAAALRMVVVNRRRKTWRSIVNAFVVMSEHAQSKPIEGGFPDDRIFVKPNFIEEPGIAATPPSSSRTILYAGRLAPEKGISNLLTAWSEARLDPNDRLLIVGDGPERPALEQQATRFGLRKPQVTFTGWRDRSEIFALLGGVRAVVLIHLVEGGGCPVAR